MIPSSIMHQGASRLEYLRNLNRALHAPGLTPIGAYCFGVVEVELRRVNCFPDRALLERAAACNSVAEAVALAKEWLEARTAELGLRP